MPLNPSVRIGTFQTYTNTSTAGQVYQPSTSTRNFQFTQPSTDTRIGSDAGTQEYGQPHAAGMDSGMTGAYAKPADADEMHLRAEASRKSRLEKKYQALQYEYDTYLLPQHQADAKAIEQEALNEANRALAEAQARYGYMRSAGAGTAGMWEMGMFNLEGKALQVRESLSTLNAAYLRDVRQAWMDKKDQQQFQEHMLKLQADYREQYAEKIAGLNDSSWWSKLGSIAGIITALIPGGTVAATGGATVGGGVQHSATNWLNR